MRKLYEILKILQVQKIIVSAETIRRNTVISCQATNHQAVLQESSRMQTLSFTAKPFKLKACWVLFLSFFMVFTPILTCQTTNVITVLKLKQYYIGLVLRFFISRSDHNEKRERHTYLNSKHHILLTFLRFFVRSIQIFAKIPVRKKKVAMCSGRLS